MYGLVGASLNLGAATEDSRKFAEIKPSTNLAPPLPASFLKGTGAETTSVKDTDA